MPGWTTVSKWELKKSGSKFDRKVIILLISALCLMTIVIYAASMTGFGLNQKIYTVASSQSDINSIIAEDQRFDVNYIENTENKLNFDSVTDIIIIGNTAYLSGTDKSFAAAQALETILISHRETTLSSYDSVNNSHPVWVIVHDIDRPESFQVLGDVRDLDHSGKGNRDSETAPADIAQTDDKSTEIAPPSDISDVGGQSIHSDERFGLGHQTSSLTLFQTQTTATPSHFNPPIPFMAILYSFLFIFPIYIVSQLYSSSIMEERTNRKCQLLLAAPLRSTDIVLGKSMPYFIATILLVLLISVFIQRPATLADVQTVIVMIAVLLPVILLFMALSFIAAIFSRSFKELTFAMVFSSVIVSGYLFFPAMFANIHTISSISPMTLIVNTIEGKSFDPGTYVFSTLPFYLVGLSLYGFGTSIFKEENLFGQKDISEKVLDCFQRFLELPGGSVFTLSLISIPFIYMLQLMFIIVLFNLPMPYSVISMIFLSAFVEEIAKSAGIFTIVKKKLIKINILRLSLLILLAGTGFFAGEKLISAITLSPIEASVFGFIMSMGSLLLYPLMLHISTTAIVGFGLYYLDTKYYLPLLLIATGVHSLYNFYLLRGIIFG